MTHISACFKGKLVNLKPVSMEQMSQAYVLWLNDTEYARLADDDPAGLYSARDDQEWLEKNWDDIIMFGIHTVAGDELIGSIELAEIRWASGDAWVGIGIGEKKNWGKGYGTEAMQLILRYAFEELNLHRVSLSVFDYNPRGIRSYEKAGFQEEGRIREYIMREGRKWDLVFMGVLRSEWEAARAKAGLKA